MMATVLTTQRALVAAPHACQSIARVSNPASATHRRSHAPTRVQCVHTSSMRNIHHHNGAAATLAALVLTLAPTPALAETFAPETETTTSPPTEVVAQTTDDTNGPGRDSKVPRRSGDVLLDYAKTFDKEETRSVLKTLVHFLTVTQHQSMEVLDGETVMERIDALSEDKSTPLHAEAKKELRNWARSITPIQMKSYFDCRLSAEVEVGVPTAVASMTASTHMHPFHMHPFHTCIHCDPFVIPHMCIHSASR